MNNKEAAEIIKCIIEDGRETAVDWYGEDAVDEAEDILENGE